MNENEKIMGHLYDIFIEIDKLSDEEKEKRAEAKVDRTKPGIYKPQS